MGLGRLFIDPIDAKKTVKNSEIPTVGSVAIFDWSNNPNATLAQQKYGHVGIVTAVN
jgi:surface antigen